MIMILTKYNKKWFQAIIFVSKDNDRVRLALLKLLSFWKSLENRH